MSHTFCDGATVIGTTNRLRQLEADHQKDPSTARFGLSWLFVFGAPGAKCAVLTHSASVSMQLMPMIGMTTIEHGTDVEQPSDWFSAAVRISNGTEPVPSARVGAACSFAGSAVFPETPISGVCVDSEQAQYRRPFPATKGM